MRFFKHVTGQSFVTYLNHFRIAKAQVVLANTDRPIAEISQEVLPVLVKNGIGALAMKTLGRGAFLGKGTFAGGREDVLTKLQITPAECRQYAICLPVSVVISGMDDLVMLKTNVDIACRFRQMAEAEIATLLAKARELASTGRYAWFKSYPSGRWTAENPWVLG